MSRKRNKRWDKLARGIKARHLQRHGAICGRCGRVRADLECHHKQSIEKRPDLEMDPDNIEVICFQCHQKIHEKPIPQDQAEWNALIQTRMEVAQP